ncbi:hypothetical protein [Rhizobium glycinendophyticum]|nr:hypothetical protein [Rhizobium glycinendophyticum]
MKTVTLRFIRSLSSFAAFFLLVSAMCCSAADWIVKKSYAKTA